MLKRFAAIIAAFLIASTAGLAVAGPARADIVQGCYSNAICFYDKNISGAPFWERDAADSDFGTCYSMGSLTSWIRNRSSKQFRVYKTTTCEGTSAIVYANSVGAMSSEWSNVIRGVRRVS